jgi:serine/threonine-protein kinase
VILYHSATIYRLAGIDGFQEARGTRMPDDVNDDFNDDPLVGTVMAKKFELLSVVEYGTTTNVYKARHTERNFNVAFKIMNDEAAHHPDSAKRFYQDVKALAKVDHPGVVSIYDIGQQAHIKPYVVEDYISGLTLNQAIEFECPLRLERFFNIFEQLTDAISAVHKKGITPRTVRPSKIMLVQDDDDNEYAIIISFGGAHVKGLVKEESAAAADESQAPEYMSPEECIKGIIDARSNIYSIGCMMYEALTGEIPFYGNTFYETAQKHINEPVPRLLPRLTGLPAADKIEAMVFKALRKRPEERFQTAQEVHDAVLFVREAAGMGGVRKPSPSGWVSKVKNILKRG